MWNTDRGAWDKMSKKSITNGGYFMWNTDRGAWDKMFARLNAAVVDGRIRDYRVEPDGRITAGDHTVTAPWFCVTLSDEATVQTMLEGAKKRGAICDYDIVAGQDTDGPVSATVYLAGEVRSIRIEGTFSFDD